ncbi:MAG: oligoendopeptidase F [Candidatus Zixiibacteriota bacterium]
MKQSQIWRALLVGLVAAIAINGPALAQSAKAKQRSEIEPQYQWKVEHIYNSEANWEKDFNVIKDNIGRFEAFKGHLGESSENLRHFLELSDSLSLISDNLYVYAYLKLDENNKVSKYQELGDRITGLNSQFRNAVAFADPEILAIDASRLQEFLRADPQLAVYRFYLERIVRSKEHILSDKEEALLALAGPVMGAPGRIFAMADDADLTFGSIKDESGNDVQLTKERYSKFLESTDRRVRRDAADMFYGTYEKFANTLAGTLSSSVKKDYFLMQARKYNSCIEMSLDADSIPTSVFRTMIDAANANLAPLHKWAGLRKRILQLDTLHPYDLYAPLLSEKGKDYTWDEAKKIVLDGLAPLGKQYQADFGTGLNSGWIDVYENEGKGSGAYCWGTYSSHPYLLMNYNGSLDWVFTLSHEMGHAMNSFYSNRNEPYIYHDHSLFTAEVASTCNEAILMKYLLKNTSDKKEKMRLLTQYIEQIIGTFYTQLMFSEFELAIHEQVEKGDALSVDFFRKTYREIYQKYWGPELVMGPLNDLRGMGIGHFYRQYYVYQYATSYAAAQTLSQRILDKEKGALEAYLTFLKKGSSKYPVALLKDAGVDMTTTEPVNRTIRLFAGLVDEMEKLLNQN